MMRTTLLTIAVTVIPGRAFPDAAGAADAVQDRASIVAEARAIVDSYHELGWFSGSVLLAQAGTAQYPLLDGRCDEYPHIGAEVLTEGHEISVLLFQDAEYVWLCYTLPDQSYGTLDLEVDSPGLADPVNLHVSAQLGEWRVGHPEDVPQSAESDRWWNVQGWWSNAVSWNGTRETDDGSRPNFRMSEGRELQLSKTRFGRGSWRLRFSIGAVQNPDDSLKQIVLPSKGEEPIVVEIF